MGEKEALIPPIRIAYIYVAPVPHHNHVAELLRCTLICAFYITTFM